MDDNEVKVCKFRKKPSVSELFKKSLKFFGLMNVSVLTVASFLKYVIGINPIYIATE